MPARIESTISEKEAASELKAMLRKLNSAVQDVTITGSNVCVRVSDIQGAAIDVWCDLTVSGNYTDIKIVKKRSGCSVQAVQKPKNAG